jgi:hypothetical protein
MVKQATGRAYDWDQQRLNRIRTAQVASDLATARLQGMKARAKLCPPQAASGTFPFGHARTCAEWRPFETWQERRNP